MDQVRIGKFIAKCRKESGLTQMQLAEMLNITDRAVSKWETGKAMPDSSIMLELCGILNITVNDLLSGEVITMDDYKVNSEKLLLEMAKQKQEADKKLLALEILIGVLSMIVLLGACAVAAYVPMANWLMGCIIAAGFIVFVVGLGHRDDKSHNKPDEQHHYHGLGLGYLNTYALTYRGHGHFGTKLEKAHSDYQHHGTHKEHNDKPKFNGHDQNTDKQHYTGYRQDRRKRFPCFFS